MQLFSRLFRIKSLRIVVAQALSSAYDALRDRGSQAPSPAIIALSIALLCFSVSLLAAQTAPAAPSQSPTAPVQPADKPSISLTPAVVMAKGSIGQTLSQTLTLTNQTARDFAFEMVAEDVVIKDGKRVFVTAGETPNSIAASAVFTQKTVLVKPFSSVSVDARLDAAGGDKYSRCGGDVSRHGQAADFFRRRRHDGFIGCADHL